MIEPCDSADDPRLEPYRALKEREIARDGGRFIAEGEHVVRRLLASRFETESVLLSHRRVEEMAPLAPQGVPVYTLPDAEVHRVVGYRFHSGVIACGRRGRAPTIEEVVGPDSDRPLTLLIGQGISNTDNMGGLIRIAAALGADAAVFGEQCCDQFFRRSLRVSMGTVFRLPICRSDDLLRDLEALRRHHGVELIATVLDESAEPLAEAAPAMRLGLVVGNEAQGLDAATVAACDRRVTIPMRLGTDSLNVAVATAICLYHFTSRG